MELNEVKDVAKFLFDKKIIAHVDTKDGGFYNGVIVELNDSFIVIEDRVVGQTPLAFSGIKVVEKFRGKEE